MFLQISRDEFEQLYSTYVRPLLKYVNFIVQKGQQTDIMRSVEIRRTAMSLVSGSKMYPYKERLLLLNFYPLDIRHLRRDLILTFHLFAKN